MDDYFNIEKCFMFANFSLSFFIINICFGVYGPAADRRLKGAARLQIVTALFIPESVLC